jgi:hypothetical protein
MAEYERPECCLWQYNWTQHLDRRRKHSQLHSSSDGPKAPQVGIDVKVLPALPVPLLDAAPAPLDPKPLRFGLVAVLQNVAVISSWQIMPVSVSRELFIVPPAPSACCCDCAAPGDPAQSEPLPRQIERKDLRKYLL